MNFVEFLRTPFFRTPPVAASVIIYVFKYPSNLKLWRYSFPYSFVLKGSYLCWWKWSLELWPYGYARSDMDLTDMDPSLEMEKCSNSCSDSDVANMALHTWALLLDQVRVHPLITNGKFSEKLTFLSPWYPHVYLLIRGLEMLVFRNILRTYLMDGP